MVKQDILFVLFMTECYVTYIYLFFSLDDLEFLYFMCIFLLLESSRLFLF